MSAIRDHARWLQTQDFASLSLSHYLDFAADSIGTLFVLTIAVLVLIRYRRVLATESWYPRVVTVGCFAFALSLPFLPKHELPTVLTVISLLVTVVGAMLALTVLLVLGRSFSILPEARRLVLHGPYRFVRHPLYATELVVQLGVLIQLAIWPTIPLFLVQLLFLVERMRIEEAVLSQAFPEYTAYARRTPRLIPGLW